MLLDDLKTYLDAQGASSVSWPIRLAYLPDDSDQAIALFETGGYPADTLGRENQRVTFQLRVRAGRLDYQTARAKWQECFDLLQDARQGAGSPELLPGVVFIQARHYGPLAFTDDKGRFNLTANFNLMRTGF